MTSLTLPASHALKSGANSNLPGSVPLFELNSHGHTERVVNPRPYTLAAYANFAEIQNDAAAGHGPAETELGAEARK